MKVRTRRGGAGGFSFCEFRGRGKCEPWSASKPCESKTLSKRPCNFAPTNGADLSPFSSESRLRKSEDEVTAHERRPIESVTSIQAHVPELWLILAAQGDAHQRVHLIILRALGKHRGRQDDERVRLRRRRVGKIVNLPLPHLARSAEAAFTTAFTSAASSASQTPLAHLAAPPPAATFWKPCFIVFETFLLSADFGS